jgi:hypothetical protein
MIYGGCHCGAVRYAITGALITHALCHCQDCRRHAGAPMVGWAMVAEEQLRLLQGAVKLYASSENGRREFCPSCGTGLFYRNAQMLPGIVDIQTATFDDPSSAPALCHIQTAERLPWMASCHTLPGFERYPPQDLPQDPP